MEDIIMEKCGHEHFFGTVKVGERGQIVIPKSARDEFDINSGDSLMVFGRDKNQILTILKEDKMRTFALKILEELDKEN